MSVRVKQHKDMSVPLSAMKDGDLAEIVSWVGDTRHFYCGRIVHRYRDRLVSIGMCSTETWEDAFTVRTDTLQACRVRILPPGTELVIE